MNSETRRMAKVLLERRSEAFQSRYARDESAARLARAIAGFAPKGMVFETAWREEPGTTWLDVRFAPSRASRIFLNSASVALTLLIAATIWSLVAPGEAPVNRFLVALLTLFAILGFPLLVVAFGSRREAEESTLRKRIRRALVEQEEERR